MMEGFAYEANPDEYIVACMVGPAVQDDFVGWPSHITVIPWFEVEKDDLASAAVQRVAMVTSQFPVLVGDQDYFGPRRNVPVMTVESSELYDVHEMLIGELENVDADMPFQNIMHERFRPHITKKRDRVLEPGEAVMVTKLYLVAAPKKQSRLTRHKRIVLAAELHI